MEGLKPKLLEIFESKPKKEKKLGTKTKIIKTNIVFKLPHEKGV